MFLVFLNKIDLIHSFLRSVVATNLWNNHARHVFPCLDHPSLRATFEISIARQTSMIAVSNMPLIETTSM